MAARYGGRFIGNQENEIQRTVREPVYRWKQAWVQPIPSSSYKVYKWVRTSETITFLQQNDEQGDSATRADARRLETEKAMNSGLVEEPSGPGARLHEDSQMLEEGSGLLGSGNETPTSGLGSDAGLTLSASGQITPKDPSTSHSSIGAVSGGLGSISGPPSKPEPQPSTTTASSLPIHMQNAVSSAAAKANNNLQAQQNQPPQSQNTTELGRPQVAHELIPQPEGLPTRPPGNPSTSTTTTNDQDQILIDDAPPPKEGQTVEQRDVEMAEGGEKVD